VDRKTKLSVITKYCYDIRLTEELPTYGHPDKTIRNSVDLELPPPSSQPNQLKLLNQEIPTSGVILASGWS